MRGEAKDRTGEGMLMAGEPPLKKIYWSLVLVFLLFSMTVAMAGYRFFGGQKKNLKQEKWDQLKCRVPPLNGG